ncbi:hypothetical protein GF361_01695 [Candidatus Woesearchaeota archaeon]|nr:hypothetical protein [Candidatus Woesearchaeota archaeon]
MMIKKLKKEMRKHTSLAISGAFALIIALVWRDVIEKMVDSFVLKLGLSETAYWYDIAVALVVTVICVIGVLISSRYSVKEE